MDQYEPKLLNANIIFPDVDWDVDEREEVVDRPRGDHEAWVHGAAHDAAQRVPRSLVEPKMVFVVKYYENILLHGKTKIFISQVCWYKVTHQVVR